ncbi:MAG TPA: GtrA family protein [Solirubrobacteraceae bacterium]|nr:GtrA family protein [Solirubrobacteraceae bacterium]
MSDDATILQLPLHLRVRAGLRKPANWLALVRFALVGASGYVVNLAVFALAVHGLGLDYRIAAVAAFVVAVTNNFTWNRLWTFSARDGHLGFQAARFLVVSLVAFGFSLVALAVLVEDAGLPKLAAQALAIAAATPLGFLGNKLWSFRG